MTKHPRRRLRRLLWLVAVCTSTAACSQAPAPRSAARTTPERITLGWSGDPAHTMSVTWRTPAESAGAVGQVAAFTADPSALTPMVTSPATDSRLDLGGGRSVHSHRVRFTGLASGSSYWYRVGEGSKWSEWFRFRTASASAEPFRFIYLGDAQNDIRSMWSRAVREAVLAVPDARFIVHGGDLVAEGWDDALWGEWTDGEGFAAAMIPSLPCPGNHDLDRPPGDPAGKTISTVNDLWRAQFTVPHNGPAEVPELADEAWFLDYQGVRIVSLDANMYTEDDFDPSLKTRAGSPQLKWLDRVLTDNPNRWTIVVHHEPVYSVGKDRDNGELRAALLPIYDRHHVDVILQGHDHAYGRTHKLAGGRRVASDRPGTVYVVSVSGPKMYALNKRFLDLMATTRTNTQMFQVISVTSDRLSYEARSITGELVDAFELRKAAGASTFTDLAPGRPAPAGDKAR